MPRYNWLAVAPDLGVRLETASSLSGACLRTGEIQHCEDTETDGRVDTEACRQLGVRSMLVMPLDGGKGPFGILEVLSARPNAFGDRDIEVLKVLARRIVASKRESEAGPVVALDVRMPAARCKYATNQEILRFDWRLRRMRSPRRRYGNRATSGRPCWCCW